MTRRIIPRSEWGARYRDGYGDASVPWLENYLHHSVTIAPDLAFNDANFDGVDDDEKAAMLRIEEIGETNFKAGISYTRLIFPSGRIYQGHSNHRAGAHTIGKNFVARAICLVGNYEENEPTQAMLDSVAWVLQQDKLAGRSNGRLTGGHQDVFATSCPGKNAYAKISYINRLAAGGLLPAEEDEVSWDEFRELASPGDRNYKENRRMDEAVGDAMFYSSATYQVVLGLRAGQDGILAALEAATSDRDITIDSMREIVNNAVEQSVKNNIQITGTVKIESKPDEG